MNKNQYTDELSANLQILFHHIYEYKKGIRNMVLHTMNIFEQAKAESRLKRDNIPYHIQPVTSQKINVFFGKEECVNIVKSFNNKPLNQLSNEQDFMLGIMLGYDRMQQCQRFLAKNELMSQTEETMKQNDSNQKSA